MRTDRYQEERRAGILALLQERDRMGVEDLAKHFKVTGATIRTDLTDLERQNKVIRTLGSARVVRQPPMYPLAERLILQSDAKRAIGRKAATLVHERDIIALDASSTSLSMTPFLKTFSEITLVTNCLPVAGEFVNHKAVKVIMPGGYLQHDSSSLVGPETADFLKGIRIGTAFLGARSISLERGLCDSDPATMDFKKALVQVSGRVVALVDSSKWEAVSLTSFAPLDQIDVLVSDSALPAKLRKELAGRGVEVLIA